LPYVHEAPPQYIEVRRPGGKSGVAITTPVLSIPPGFGGKIG